ncbi:type IV pilin N-terminal domain-containing protein [Haladaptatus sp. DJG-WS-42]|uniref:type IV pilin N-terminal domain-containing protein n=1 Tax=Haladaptatus sp. DJG-WS-42 TaxID=3120516 RepID=UPI0030D228A4
MKRGGWISDERAISPVIGVVMLMGIVVALFSVVGVMALSFEQELGEPVPMGVSSGAIDVSVVENDTAHSLDIVLESGQSIPSDSLSIVLSGSGSQSRQSLPNTGTLADGQWSPGEHLTLDLTTETVCSSSSSEVDMSLIYESDDGRSSSIISTQEVPVKRGHFETENGRIVVYDDYEAEVTVLGTGFTYGADGPNIPISLALTAGGDSATPWSDVNDDGNPRTYTFEDREKGDAISVIATASSYSYFDGSTRSSVADDGIYVYTLRDGDSVPNFEGFGGQDSVDTYMQAYIDDGAVTLDENQAIFLFELGDSETGSSADFQDVVVLVSLETTAEKAIVEQNSDGENIIYCPVT